MKYLVWLLLLALVLLHQSGLVADEGHLVLGFLPAGLAFHAGISLAAALVWWLATIYAWPDDLELLDSQRADGGEPR